MVDFGSAQSIEIGKRVATVVGGEGCYDNVETRIEKLKEEILQIEDIHEASRTQERITRLSSGVAIIRVGASSEVEMIEKKHRIEDALEAVNSARQEGVVPGGGVTLLQVADILVLNIEYEDRAAALWILIKSLQAPFKTMAQNAGRSVDLSISLIENSKEFEGINFATGRVENLLTAGIIDPAKVTKCALRNAISVAGTLLLTNHSVVEM